mmetsp:Transcript_52015/g.146573  ORF Transcript_52015/g.146573 Transcript_52015/m.146573 type:complete len:226 (+) Transcript_52015:371-1048(+)
MPIGVGLGEPPLHPSPLLPHRGARDVVLEALGVLGGQRFAINRPRQGHAGIGAKGCVAGHCQFASRQFLDGRLGVRDVNAARQGRLELLALHARVELECRSAGFLGDQQGRRLSQAGLLLPAGLVLPAGLRELLQAGLNLQALLALPAGLLELLLHLLKKNISTQLAELVVVLSDPRQEGPLLRLQACQGILFGIAPLAIIAGRIGFEVNLVGLGAAVGGPTKPC